MISIKDIRRMSFEYENVKKMLNEVNYIFTLELKHEDCCTTALNFPSAQFLSKPIIKTYFY